MPTTNRPQPGRIVWVETRDSAGRPTHPHPAVILSRKEDIDAGRPIVVALISTQLNLSKPEEQVPLMWMRRPGGHPVTRLNRKCAAVCTWLEAIQESDILEYAGVVNRATFEEILKKVDELGT